MSTTEQYKPDQNQFAFGEAWVAEIESSEIDKKPIGIQTKIEISTHKKFGNGIFRAINGVTEPTPDTELSIPLRNTLATLRREAKKEHTYVNTLEFLKTRDQPNQLEQKLISLTKELYKHKLVEVDTKYGILGGQISILNAENQSKLPPIILIPGSSNEPKSIETFAVRLAFETQRTVFVIGYPDSPAGKTSYEFTKAVVENPYEPFEPYTEYFGAQIQQLIRQGIISENFDAAGYSGGGALWAKLLLKKEYQQSVNNAMLFCPAGATSFSDKSFTIGALSQLVFSLSDRKRMIGVTWYDDPRDKNKSRDKDMKFASFLALASGAHNRINEWETMKVRNGGKIVVFSGGRDEVTKSRRTFSDKTKPKNDQIEVVYDPIAHHNSIGSFPEHIIPRVYSRLYHA